MTTVDVLLPSAANNDYRGGRVPLYFFYILIAMMTFRSLVHFLLAIRNTLRDAKPLGEGVPTAR